MTFELTHLMVIERPFALENGNRRVCMSWLSPSSLDDEAPFVLVGTSGRCKRRLPERGSILSFGQSRHKEIGRICPLQFGLLVSCLFTYGNFQNLQGEFKTLQDPFESPAQIWVKANSRATNIVVGFRDSDQCSPWTQKLFE